MLVALTANNHNNLPAGWYTGEKGNMATWEWIEIYLIKRQSEQNGGYWFSSGGANKAMMRLIKGL